MTRYPQGPATSPGFLLWLATLRWQRLMTETLRPLDLTHVQFVLLASTWWLNQTGERPTQAELSTHTGSDARMTSEVVRRLEARGLVVRAAKSEDARALRLRVTRSGGALARKAIAAVEAADDAFFAPVRGPRFVAALQTLAER